MEAGCVQISVGQEHVTCLSLLAELPQTFTSPSTVEGRAEKPDSEKSEAPDHTSLLRSFDDIRAGSFRYVTASGKRLARNVHCRRARKLASNIF